MNVRKTLGKEQNVITYSSHVGVWNRRLKRSSQDAKPMGEMCGVIRSRKEIGERRGKGKREEKLRWRDSNEAV